MILNFQMAHPPSWCEVIALETEPTGLNWYVTERFTFFEETKRKQQGHYHYFFIETVTEKNASLLGVVQVFRKLFMVAGSVKLVRLFTKHFRRHRSVKGHQKDGLRLRSGKIFLLATKTPLSTTISHTWTWSINPWNHSIFGRIVFTSRWLVFSTIISFALSFCEVVTYLQAAWSPQLQATSPNRLLNLGQFL